MQIANSSGSAPDRRLISFSVGVIVLVWALNFVAAKIGLRHLAPLAMASFRIVFAGTLMVPIYFAFRHGQKPSAHPPDKSWFTARDLWAFLYLGLFGVAVNQTCFTVGLYYTSVTHAAVIVGLGPIYTLVLAVIVRVERATWRKAAGMAVAFLGIVLLASERGKIGRAHV